jgi:hypothetical protein
MEGDVRQMATQEIEQKIAELETAYSEALAKGEDIHALSSIWKRIKELQYELKNRQL